VIDRGIFYIPQESSLFVHMSVENNLRLPLEHLARRPGGPGSKEIEARLDDLFGKFPVLRERRRSNAGDLSGGQQKMLEFAKAYLVQPRLCLVDEPSIGLAPKVAEEVYRWIQLIAERRTAILLVDHNVRRVVRLSGYVYVLSLGEIAAEGPPDAFAGDLHEEVRGWLGIDF
jgi:branched-chain amino acid transport system ATP-binding protein